jgi:hypothetical protein
VVVNGREYEWASLFARLDQHLMTQERRELATLMHQDRIARAMDELPQRIANAILVSGAHAALMAPASRLSGWTVLAKQLSRAGQWLTATLGLLLLATGRIGWDDLGAFLAAVLR